MAKLKLDMLLDLKDRASKKLDKFNKKLDKTRAKMNESSRVTADVKGGGGEGRGRGPVGAIGGPVALAGLVSINGLLSKATVLINSAKTSLEKMSQSFRVLNSAVAKGIPVQEAWNKSSRRINQIYDSSNKRMNRNYKSILKLKKGTDKLTRAQKRNSKSLGGLNIGLGKYGALIGGLGLVLGLKHIISVGAKFESLKATLASVTSGTEEAEKAFELIKDTASKLPTTIEETTTAFIRMQALGIVPTQERMLAFGNVAAAMGKSIIQFTEAVADASVNEFERLKEFGIKSSVQGDKISFRFKGLTKTIGNNSVEIVDFLENIGKVEFGTAAARQMETLTGKTSNLKDAIAELEDTMARGGINDFVKTLVSALIQLVKWFNESYIWVRRFGVGVTGIMAKAAIQVKYIWIAAMLHIESAWGNIIKSHQNLWAKFINSMKESINKMAATIGMEKVFTDFLPIKQYRDFISELDKLNEKRREEIAEHEKAMGLWAEDVELTQINIDVVKDYNDVLKARDKLQRDSLVTLSAYQKFWKGLNKDTDDVIRNTNFAMDAMADLDSALQDGTITGEKYSMMLNKLNEMLGIKTPEAAKEASDSMSEFAKEAARGIQQNFSDFLFDVMQGEFTNLADRFKQTLDRMFADLLASQLAKALFGGFGETGVVGGILGGMFSGRADGGPVSSGTPYVVGENGPELFVPKVNGGIINNDDINSSIGSSVTNNWNISALDGADLKRILEKDRRYITELVKGTSATYNT